MPFSKIAIQKYEIQKVVEHTEEIIELSILFEVNSPKT